MVDNRENNIWTVYVHIVPQAITEYDYDKYYVGITSKSVEKRWMNDGYGYRTQVFYRAIKKYGWDNIEHYVIAEHLTQKEAEKLEIKLIKELDCNAYKGNKRGYNITDGGKGHNGQSPSKEARKKLSIRFSNGKAPFYGKKHSLESLIKIRQNHPSFKREKHPNAKKIYKFDINGNYIKTYNCVKDAQEELNILNSNYIYYGAKLHKKMYNFLWGFDKDIVIIDGIPKLNYIYEERYSNQDRVYQFSTNGDYINTYISCKEANRITNIDSSCISKVARKEKRYNTAGGYVWRYERDIDFDKNNKPILKGDDKYANRT